MAGHVILLTGATGAVGVPLLDHLLARDDVERVIALQHAERVRPRDRVTIVPGNITAPGLAIEPAAAAALTNDVTAIVHAAADTHFERPSLEVNVRGTTRVLDFARHCRRLDRFVALSTTHVAGRRTGVIAEPELEHDAGFVNAYEASKYDAEVELRARMNELPIAVCRISTVVGDSATGAIARDGAIHHAIRLMYAGLAPMVPGSEDSPVDIVASDYAAPAIATLSTAAFAPAATWHVCAGGDTIPAGELLDRTLDAFIRYRPSWRRRTIARPVVVPLDTFDLFCRSAEQAGDAGMRAAAATMAAFAPQLAFPKRFDDRECRGRLTAFGIIAPAARDTWDRAIRRIVGSAS
jgi:nucleoside-diphosphate-sugar epimerase